MKKKKKSKFFNNFNRSLAKVLFNFQSENDWEITCSEGDIIKILKIHDDGWSDIEFNKSKIYYF
jgi:hypothetical protein